MTKKSNESYKLPKRVADLQGRYDMDGLCWTDREFAYPDRTIRIASTFSGIGAPEMALKRLGLKTRHVFACDIGERYLKYSYSQLRTFAKNLSDTDKKLFADYLYEGNKAQRMNDTLPFTRQSVWDNLFLADAPSKITLELVKECIDLITKGMDYETKMAYITSLYDKKGVNYVKESFCANYDIRPQDFYTDIRFLDASRYKGLVDIYCGGSPCTSYSISGKRLGLEDTRGTLFYDFARTIKQCEPKVFIFENVMGMMSCGKSKDAEGNAIVTGLEAAVDVFQELGYKIFWKVLDGRNYGIPQHRERIWLIGFKEPKEFLYPRPIKLAARMYDYLDEDIPPRSGNVSIPGSRELTGTECLRLQGFFDFKVADSIRALGKKRMDFILSQQAGNSMVVDCLMAIFKQMDVSQYGVDFD